LQVRASRRLLLLSGSLLLAAPASAQEEDELKLLFEQTQVTTASKTAEPAALAPADVTVITEDEIRRSGARDLSDILRTVVGIEVTRDQFGAIQIVSRGLLSHS
jgi:outer membrane receptor for ferrienterochelin and colicin